MVVGLNRLPHYNKNHRSFCQRILFSFTDRAAAFTSKSCQSKTKKTDFSCSQDVRASKKYNITTHENTALLLWLSSLALEQSFFPSPLWLQLKTILHELFRNFISLSHAFSSFRKSWNQVVKPILPSSAQVSKVITWFRNRVDLLPFCNSMSFHWRFSQAGKTTLARTIKRGRNDFREWNMGAHSCLVHVVFSSP